MRIAVLGTGMVGDAIASKLVSLGHEVMMGSRDANNPKAREWSQRVGPRAKTGSFADAARFGELLFNCTNGANSITALQEAGEANLGDKTLIDVTNVLPPDPSSTGSLGEQIQKTFPRLKVVKTLNTVNCQVMVDPTRVPGAHTIFLCGNDDRAKQSASGLLEAFGWKDIVDLGDISNARAIEAYMPLWLALWKKLGTSDFNIEVVRRS
jgi:predicted dinucleotide-binding enzyme